MNASIIEDLRDRIRQAKADERDHAHDAWSIRRELAGYTRGLKDALFALERKGRDR